MFGLGKVQYTHSPYKRCGLCQTPSVICRKKLVGEPVIGYRSLRVSCAVCVVLCQVYASFFIFLCTIEFQSKVVYLGCKKRQGKKLILKKGASRNNWSIQSQSLDISVFSSRYDHGCDHEGKGTEVISNYIPSNPYIQHPETPDIKVDVSGHFLHAIDG